MQRLMGMMRSAMQRYGMVKSGDRIAVGLSGGKDSVALLSALHEMRRYYPVSYELAAVTIDPQFSGTQTDYGALSELCRRLRIPYKIRRTNLAQIIFGDRNETNPCSLCARLRRGMLHNAALEMGCNKIALGHHLDDAAETFYMNLWCGGRIACFSPVSYLSRKNITMIRPMIFAYEKDVRQAVKRRGLPYVKSRCPADGQTERQKTKDRLRALEETYGGLRVKTVEALRRAGIDGW